MQRYCSINKSRLCCCCLRFFLFRFFFDNGMNALWLKLSINRVPHSEVLRARFSKLDYLLFGKSKVLTLARTKYNFPDCRLARSCNEHTALPQIKLRGSNKCDERQSENVSLQLERLVCI